MESKNANKKITRRYLLAGVLAVLSLPLKAQSKSAKDEQSYQILLKSDGTTVKVPKAVVKSSKVINPRLSNKKLLNWIKREKP